MSITTTDFFKETTNQTCKVCKKTEIVTPEMWLNNTWKHIEIWSFYSNSEIGLVVCSGECNDLFVDYIRQLSSADRKNCLEDLPNCEIKIENMIAIDWVEVARQSYNSYLECLNDPEMLSWDDLPQNFQEAWIKSCKTTSEITINRQIWNSDNKL